tara:strand:- start:23 stop:640 length:618 start_codon:yes stop_codon:yes gene_type:complete
MGLISNGTTIFDAGAMSLGGSMTFIKKLTASGSANLSFVDGASSVVLDNTYKEYLFTFNNMHPASDNKDFQFNLSIDSGSNYNVAKTSTVFVAYNAEADNDRAIEYSPGQDLAQGTGFQNLASGYGGVGADNDQNLGGYLHLFNPSSTTFVKHFFGRSNVSNQINFSADNHCAGYGNTTSAVNAVQFKFNSGNIDAGFICLYGIA